MASFECAQGQVVDKVGKELREIKSDMCVGKSGGLVIIGLGGVEGGGCCGGV